GPESVRAHLGAKALPQGLQLAFEDAEVSLDKSLEQLKENLSRLDVTLADASARTGSKIRYQLKRLKERAARAEMVRNEVLDRKWRLLNNALYPNKTLQERELGGINFLARHGLDLLRLLYQTMNAGCIDHHVVSI